MSRGGTRERGTHSVHIFTSPLPLLDPSGAWASSPPPMGRSEACLPKQPAIRWQVGSEPGGRESICTHSPKNVPPPRERGLFGHPPPPTISKTPPTRTLNASLARKPKSPKAQKPKSPSPTLSTSPWAGGGGGLQGPGGQPHGDAGRTMHCLGRYAWHMGGGGGRGGAHKSGPVLLPTPPHTRLLRGADVCEHEESVQSKSHRGGGGLSLAGGGGVIQPSGKPPPKGAHLTAPQKYGDWPGGDPDPKFGKKNTKMGCLESARRGGAEKSLFAVDLVEKNNDHLLC